MATVPRSKIANTRGDILRGGKLRQVAQPDPGAAISDVGASLGNIALAKAEIQRKTEAAFQKASDSRTLNNEIAKASRGLILFKQSQKDNPDNFDNWAKDHDDFTSKTLEDARKRLNPAVFDAFNASYGKSSTKSFADTLNASRNVLVDKGKSDLDVNLSVYNDMYATSKDPADRRSILGQALLSISDSQNTGIISEQSAADKREAFLQSVETTRLENDILENPEAAEVNFAEGEYAISEESKPAFQKKIETAVEATKRERANIAEKNEQKQEKVLKQSQDDLEIDFVDLRLQGTLTSKQIITAGQQRKLRPAQVKSLLSDLDKPDRVNSDPSEYVDTLEDILAGQMSTERILANPGLSVADKKTFTGMVTTSVNLEDREKENKQKEDQKRIIASITPFIISTGPLAQFVKQDEQILLQSAVQESRERLASGETPDAIKVDLIARYNRVPISLEQLPKLRYGSPENLDLAEKLLIQNFKSGKITAAEGNRQATLINQYKEAIKNQKILEQLNKDSKRKK